MSNLWLKIKVWSKVVIFALVALYALLFIYNNSGRPIEVWFWFRTMPQMSVIVILLCSFLLGVLATILVRTIYGTIRQIRQLRQRGRTERLVREMADIKAKAGMLKTRPEPATAPPPAPAPAPAEDHAQWPGSDASKPSE